MVDKEAVPVNVSELIFDSSGSFGVNNDGGIYFWIRERLPDSVYEKLIPGEDYVLVTRIYKMSKNQECQF